MSCYAGDLANKGTPSEMMVWEKLFQLYKDDKEAILGYKDPSLGKSVDDTPSFIIISKQFGILLIDVIDDEFKHINNDDDDFWVMKDDQNIISRDDVNQNFIYEIENRFKQNKNIRKEYTNLKEKITTFIIFSQNDCYNDIKDVNAFDARIKHYSKGVIDELEQEINSLKKNNGITEELYNEIISELDSTNILNKSTNKPKANYLETMDDYIQKSLEYTFKLDDIQRAIAKQIPDGPQRIRGLAGTGKTVVLCMKAAIAHKMHPDYKILFVFNTKSMINEIKNNISKYYEKETQRGVNWDNLQVLHAWGGAELEGLYSKTCKDLGINRLAFSDVKRYKDGLESIYEDLLKNKDNLKEKYDLVLIDEAQDFPPSFFETIFYLTKEPKRIIWAYDEFQSLKDIRILEPEQMFGKKQNETFNIPNTLINGKYIGEIEKDYALKNSYRNPGYNLMVAHALALGLHRENGIIDALPDKNSWEAIGYQIEQPNKMVFKEGDHMIISRPQETCKNILSKLLADNNRDTTQLIEFKNYENHLQEIEGVANKINNLIKNEGIEPSQIFVITLDTKSSKKTLSALKDELLEKYDIKSIMPGYNYDTGQIFRDPGYVTLTTPWKAKGNEANIVFVLNAQMAYTDTSYRNRNALFVSITRSRGWCYISGTGIALTKLSEEANCIIKNNLKFDFIYPDNNTLERNRKKIQQSDYIKEDKINELFDEYEDLLIDKLKNDPDLWEKIQKQIGQ